MLTIMKKRLRQSTLGRLISRSVTLRLLLVSRKTQDKSRHLTAFITNPANHQLPSTIHIETRTMCNGRCSFCPSAVQYKLRPDELMSEELFKKIIGDLAESNYSGRVSLYCNNDPFLDSRIFDLLAYSRERLPSALLELKTNGIALTWDKTLCAFNSGLDQLHITDYMEDIAGPHRPNIEEIRSNALRSRRFNLLAEGHSFRIKVSKRYVNEVLRTRAGLAPNRFETKSHAEVLCLRPFEMMTVNPLGIVAMCSEDVLFREPMGDLKIQTIKEVWNGIRYREARALLLRGSRKSYQTCTGCDYVGISEDLVQRRG